MRRTLVAVGALACAIIVAAPAHSAGLNLRWQNCYGDAGTASRTSACTSTLGSAGTLVGSFVLGSPLQGVTGVEANIDFTFDSASIPAWWLFNAPGGQIGCRGAAMNANPTISGAAVNCVDWAGGQASGGLVSYALGFAGTNTARATVGFATASPTDLLDGPEYFAFNLSLSMAKTVGTGACTGCTTPACIAVNSIRISRSGGVEPLLLSGAASGAGSNFVSWQGGGTVAGTCALPDTDGFSIATYVVGRGAVSRSRDKPIYPPGSPIGLFATPLPGDRFIAWSGDTTTTEDSLEVVVTRPLTFYATFERDPAAAPALTSVSDVTSDQGSFVRIQWNRSFIDDPLFPSSLCCYRIERTLTDAPGAPWVAASGSIAANRSPTYSQVVTSPADSTASDPAVRRYRVVAMANGATGEWLSNELPGYSVDNIAPPSPTSVSGVMSSGAATLFWPAVSAADFDHYAIYRAADRPPAIDAAHRLATTTGTDFNDSPGYFARYAVTALDHHGNESPATAFVTLNNTDVPGKPAPKALSFGSPYPSPMSRNMTLSVGLPHAMPVTIDVLDSQGRLVRQLASGERSAGWLTVTWDAHDARGSEAAAGVYFVRVQTPEGRSVKRVVLVP